MPGFKRQAKVLFCNRPVQCALCVLAMLLLSHANGNAQSLPSCSWRLETDGSGITNVAYPDTDATYWTMPVDTTQWKQVILRGQYPRARFFSFTTYVAQGSVADQILDVDITPNAGSVNPFVNPPNEQPLNYTVNIGGPSGQTNQVNFGNTQLAWIIYRIYVANRSFSRTAGVALPAVTLVDANGGKHSIAPCQTSRDQQIVQLINDLRADGLNILADYWQIQFTNGDDGGFAPDPNCQPDDNVVFWIPANTGGYFPNPYNKYIAGPALCYQPGKVVVVRGKAADFPDTYNNHPVWQPALPGSIQLRYWSMCNNEQVAPFRVVECQPDHATNLDSEGYYTYVLSKGDAPPHWLPPYATWLPWGPTSVSNILIFRNMVPTTSPLFVNSVQAAIKLGCAVNNVPNMPPSRSQIVVGGLCAEGVMREYYPKAVFCDVSVFQNGGWQACF